MINRKAILPVLVDFAKKMSDDKGLPILFDTDMKDYAEIYQHLNTKRYSSFSDAMEDLD